MTDSLTKFDVSDGSNVQQTEWVDTAGEGLVQLEGHPELIRVVAEAVDEVIAGSTIDIHRHPDLLHDAEQAAVAKALASYTGFLVSARQAGEAANRARRAQALLVAATAEAVAEVASDAAAEVHNVEDAAADYVAWVAANTASELATLLGLDNWTAASTAATLVIEAVSEAAAVNTEARAEAASNVARAAADAAADVAEQAASTALAAESDAITNALDRRQDALNTCYEVAAAAAQAVLNHHAGADFQAHRPPEREKRPA